MAQAFKNTFTGGLDLDTSIDKYPSNRYLDCNNFRIITKDGLATGSLETVKGNKEVLRLPTGQTLLSSTRLRGDLILFAIDSGNICYFYIVNIDLILDATVPIQIFATYYFQGSGHLIYKGTLGWTVNTKVTAISNYENTTVQKLYFITGEQPLRQLNIINSDSNNLVNLSEESLSMLPVFDADPTLSLTVNNGGNMKVGTTQYFLQYYQRNGAESTIFASQEAAYITDNGKRGAAQGEFANRSVTITFDNISTIYNRYRVIAADYVSLSDVPTLRIVTERELFVGTISATDSGQTEGVVLAEELNVVKTEYTPQTIETKDNLLLIGSISEDFFNITDADFDSRAYRFDFTRNARLYTVSTGSFVDVDGTNPIWDDVSLDHDVYNRYNNIANDYDVAGVGKLDGSIYPYFRQLDGVTIGGSGKYISYNFTSVLGEPLDTNSVAEISNPIIDPIISKGFQRGEIYRFAIVFYDKKGRQSFAKWIADIRMPQLREFPHVDLVVDTIYPNILYPQFQVELPTVVKDQISGYKIVCVERTSANRSIQANGIMSPCVSNGDDSFKMGLIAYQSDDSREYVTFGNVRDYFATNLSYIADRADNNIPVKELTEFVSPEINYNKNIEINDGDHFSVESLYTTVLQTENESHGSHFVYTKFRKTTEINRQHRSRTPIHDGRIVNPVSYKSSTERIAGFNYLTHMFDVAVADEVQGAKAGSRLICHIDPFTGTGLNNSTYTDLPHAYMIATYRRDNTNQYGGGSLSSRIGETYIEASDFIVVDGSYSDIADRTVTGGDTFITMFEYLRGLGDEKRGSEDRMQEVCFIPLESSINTQLKTNRFQSLLTNSNDYDDDKDVYFLQETVSQGLQDYPRNVTDSERYGYPLDATDLYTYNSAYSTPLNLKNYFSKPFDFEEIVINDTRVRISEKKINNEYTDSWTKFLPNNFLDIDSRYGKLVILNNYKNNILYFQDKGYGLLSINQRSLINDNNATTLALGTGGVLERFDYLETEVGLHSNTAIVESNTNLYFIGSDNQFYVFTGSSSIPASKAKNIRTLLNSAALLGTVLLAYDEENDEVLVTLKDSKVDRYAANTFNTTLVYNEIQQVFTGFYSFIPEIYINNGIFLSSDNSEDIYLHNVGDRGSFYGGLYKSSIRILVNPNTDQVNVFDNLDITTESELTDFFDELIVSNNIQDSGTISLIPDSNVKRKWRTWRLVVPRVTEGTRNNRLTDTHIIIELSRSQSVDRFICNDLITYFRTPTIRR